mgnify:CR=1 FL=1
MYVGSNQCHTPYLDGLKWINGYSRDFILLSLILVATLERGVLREVLLTMPLGPNIFLSY